MLPYKHLIITSFLALILLLIFPSIGVEGVFIIIFFGFFIDVDHYLFYAFKKKDFSLVRAYKWFIFYTKRFRELPLQEQKKTYISICFFHGFELVILFLLLGIFFYQHFLFASLGLVIHLALDLYDGPCFCDTKFYRLSIFYGIFAQKKLEFVDS